MASSTYGQGNVKEQLRKCWQRDFDWTLLPEHISKATVVLHTFPFFLHVYGIENTGQLAYFKLAYQQTRLQLVSSPTQAEFAQVMYAFCNSML